MSGTVDNGRYFSLMNDSFSAKHTISFLQYYSANSTFTSMSYNTSGNFYIFYRLPVASIPDDSNSFHHICGSLYLNPSTLA